MASDADDITRGGPEVTILMCTLNGSHFLEDQLISIEKQSARNWRLLVSDDGSTDATLDILARFQSRMSSHRVTIQHGLGKGFVYNFLRLVRDEPGSTPFCAFADQDDIWEPDKLARALEWLATVPTSIPALYCSRTTHIDPAGTELGHSRQFRGPASFANALVQSMAGGNTMVFNDAARQLVRRCGPISVAAHDWLLYILVTACGGRVNYDPSPTVRYRLHGENAIGRPAWVKRLRSLLTNRFRNWAGENLSALNSVRPHLTDQNKKIL